MSLPPPRGPSLPPPVFEPERKPKRRSWLLNLLGFGFGSAVVLFLAASAIAGYLLWNASQDLPDYESLAKYEPPVMTRIHAHDGSLIAEYARERRIFVPINTVPPLVVAAFISAEDRRFRQHGGLDWQGIARAAIKFAESKVKGGGSIQGASTITQQVAKNFLLTSERTFDRKLKEAILAIRIERAYTKDQILELYLNEIYLGLGSYGVAAAALTYFGSELEKLTVEQAAYLAALPKAPNNYHPFRRTREAIVRRNWVIDQMRQNGYLDEAQTTAAKAKQLEVNIRPLGTHIYAADYFAEEVRRLLVAQFGEDGLYGRADRNAKSDGRVNGGLSVRTTLDQRLQKIGRRALTDGLVAFDRRKGWRGPVSRIDVKGDWGKSLAEIEVPSDIAPWRLGIVLEVQRVKAVIGLRPSRQQSGDIVKEREAVEIGFAELKWAKAADKPAPKAAGDVLEVGDVVYVAPKEPDQPEGLWSLMQIPEVGGGLIAMDPNTGRVLTIVGGFSFAMSQFDRALQARRQPGSSFKPLVYAAALDNGYKPTSIVLDAPIEIDQGKGQDIWRPRNYGAKDKSYGPSTLRLGIERSRNQMTVRLAQDMGMPLIAEYARRFGAYDDLLPVLAMSLGAGETTLLRMATAYCMLANGGRQVRATLIDRIQDRRGRSIWRHDDRDCQQCQANQWSGQAQPSLELAGKQIIDPHTAYQITSMMEGVVQRGTAANLRSLGRPIAGKTGTTNDEKDAWFIGYTPDMVVGVYVGYDTPRPMGRGQTGGQVAAPIFGSFMKLALANAPPVPFRVPPGMSFVDVSLKTGLRVDGVSSEPVVREAFKPGEAPDDAYSVIGFTNEQGGFIEQTDQSGSTRAIGAGRRVY